MKAKILYEGIQRIERYFVPEAALREALLNAVCHKQYESCIPVQVSIYENRLYVANVGTLPETWTKNNLLGKHESRPYNPNVATVMYYAGFIESWGRGIEKICSACEADGLPAPEYTVHPGDIMLKFTAPEDRIVRVNDKLNDRLNDKLNVQLNEKEMQIVRLLTEDPAYTVTQLSQMMNVSRTTIANYLRKMKEKHVIKRIGSDRQGYWHIFDDDKG
jgi:ATP-dependent DNA helicase RecG